jgi:hypothetical protein
MADSEPRQWRGPAPYDPDDVRRHQEAKAEAMMTGGSEGYFRFAPGDARLLATAPVLTLVGLAGFVMTGAIRWALLLVALLVLVRASRIRVEETATGLRVVNLLSRCEVGWAEVREVRTVAWLPLHPLTEVIQLRMKRGVWRRRRVTATQTANDAARWLLAATLTDRVTKAGGSVNITSKDFGL